jgi:carboxylesterase
VTLLPGAEPFHHAGDRTGVLLVHGFTGQPKSMRPWGEFLAAQGRTVSLPRLPGHGSAWPDLNLTTWNDWYAEVDRALRELSDTCDHVFVMGLSMGGTLTLRLAEEHGDVVTGIVLVNPLVHSERPDRFLLPFLSKFIPAFPGIVNDIKKPGQDEGGYPKLPLKAAYSLTKLWPVVKQDIAKITAPVLLLHSAEDHVVEPSNSAWVLANLTSSDVTEVVLENSYHVATLDNDAELIFEKSAEFVNRLVGSVSS